MWPVFQRELIAGSRDAGFHQVRWMAALLGVGVLWLLANWIEAAPGEVGRVVFLWLHGLVSVALVLSGALVTANLVIREREEGTLGLLFLTRLTAGEVVAGKGGAAALRLFCLWLAGLPVSMVPLAMGAVSIGDVVLFTGAEAALGSAGLSAGLLASASVLRGREVVRFAVGLAIAFAVVLLAVAGLLHGFLGAVFGPAEPYFIGFCGLVSAVGLTGATLPMAGRIARQRWKESEAPRVVPVERMDVDDLIEAEWTYAWRHGPGREMRSRRPLNWLRLRVPGRITMQGWWWPVVILCWAVSLGMESASAVDTLSVVMALAMAWVGAQGYREELDNGTLEMLLTTPLPERTYLWSRIQLAGQAVSWALLLHVLLGMAMPWLQGGISIFRPWMQLWLIPAVMLSGLSGHWLACRSRKTLMVRIGTGLVVVTPWLLTRWVRDLGAGVGLEIVVMTASMAVLTGWSWAAARQDFAGREFVWRSMER